MKNIRVLGGLAALLLLGAVLVPVLLDRPGVPDQTAAVEPAATLASVLRLPTAAPSSTTPMVTIGPSGTPTPVPSPSKLGPRGRGTFGDITFPRAAAPLPARDVPPAVLAYSVDCADTTKPCWSWRLLDWKGRHWKLPPATAVTVTPNGRRIAYFQPDGRLVVRDLASGAVDLPILVPRKTLDGLRPHGTWSPNGRWLAIDYERDRRNAVLIDTTTMRSRTLDRPCCVVGLQPTGDWLLTYDQYGPDPAVFPLVDSLTGRTIQTIDPRELYDERWAKERTAYPLSPDGRRFVIFLWDREAGTHGLGLVDTTTGQVIGRHALDVEGVAWGELAGWPDARTIAILTEANGQVLTYDIQTRKLRDAYTFLDPPDRLTVAVSLVRAQ
jgi:hypothetical protein